MSLVVGMDEAGYGPNLGPLVITATAWEVPDAATPFDFWEALNPLVARTYEDAKSQQRLFVGDSKEVYTPSRGIALLEEAVLTLFSPLMEQPAGFHQLARCLCPNLEKIADIEPWYADDLPIPVLCGMNPELAVRWQSLLKEVGVTFRGVACDVVFTKRFNQTVRKYDSKGLALSRFSLALLRTLWDPASSEPAVVIADKHGGRNRYDELLAEVIGDEFIFRLEEGTPRSRYRIANTEITFQSKAESHFPVAVASMVSKYLRELAMDCWNRFWLSHVPQLKPTKGYPLDARRFRKDIAETQQRLGISDEILWRER